MTPPKQAMVGLAEMLAEKDPAREQIRVELTSRAGLAGASSKPPSH